MTVLAAIAETRGPSQVVRVAGDVAAAFDEPLVVLHAVPEAMAAIEYDHDALPVEPGMDRPAKAEAASAFAADVAERSLRADLDVEVRPEGRVGSPVESVLEAAEDLDARYLVIGGRQRSPVGKTLFGSTTQTLLLRSERPVLTVKLDG